MGLAGKRLVLILIVSLFLSSCYPSDTVGRTGYYQAYDIVRTSVPFAMDGANDASRAKVFLKETDTYGRQLFVYRTYSTFLQKSLDIWVVCQKTDSAYAYYYSNIHYLLVPRETTPSENMLANLKQENDWGEALRTDKMSKIRYVYTDGAVRYYSEDDEALLSALTERLELTEGQKIMIDKLETNGAFQTVLARVFTGGGLEGGEIVLYDVYILQYSFSDKTIHYLQKSENDFTEAPVDNDAVKQLVKSFKENIPD